MSPLFSEASFYDAVSGLFQASGLPFLIPIVAILVGGIMGIMKLFMRHRERMAMIERGIHPDFKEERPPTEEEPREMK